MGVNWAISKVRKTVCCQSLTTLNEFQLSVPTVTVLPEKGRCSSPPSSKLSFSLDTELVLRSTHLSQDLCVGSAQRRFIQSSAPLALILLFPWMFVHIITSWHNCGIAQIQEVVRDGAPPLPLLHLNPNLHILPVADLRIHRPPWRYFFLYHSEWWIASAFPEGWKILLMRYIFLNYISRILKYCILKIKPILLIVIENLAIFEWVSFEHFSKHLDCVISCSSSNSRSV